MKNQSVQKYLVLFFLLVPPIFFYWMFFRYTVDVPINDDYNAVLNFINKVINLDSVKEKLALIFSQHNEHRIVFDRLMIILCYKLNMQVNFNYLSLIGNLSLVGVFFIFYKKLRAVSTNLLYLLPISVLVFNLTFHENVTFAMAALANFTVFVFLLLSLHYVTKPTISRTDVALSLVFFGLAICTLGSGLFIVPIGALALWYRKEKKHLIVYLVVSVLMLALYFYGYEKPLYTPSVWNTFVDFKVRAILFSFAFMGNAFNYYLIYTPPHTSINITIGIGILFFILYLYIVKTRYYQKNLFIFSVMTLMVMSAFITGVSRCQFGLETAGASRYRINGVIFVIALYIWFIETTSFNKRKVNIGVIAASATYFFFCSVRQYEWLSFREYQTLMGVLRYHSGDHKFLYGFEQDMYKSALVSAAENETYFLPSEASLEAFFPYSQIIDKGTTVMTPQINARIDNIARIKDSFIFEGFAYDRDTPASGQEIFIGLKSADGKITYFSTKPEPKFDLVPYFKRWDIKNTGFFGRIKLTDLKPGTYAVSLKLVRNGEIRIAEMDKTINL